MGFRFQHQMMLKCTNCNGYFVHASFSCSPTPLRLEDMDELAHGLLNSLAEDAEEQVTRVSQVLIQLVPSKSPISS